MEEIIAVSSRTEKSMWGEWMDGSGQTCEGVIPRLLMRVDFFVKQYRLFCTIQMGFCCLNAANIFHPQD
jgi:hypothetical protein